MARIDKYLWAVRLFKTRSLAANMVKTGKVMINGEIVKASREIKVGEKFSIKKNTAVFTYEVIDLVENRVGAKLVENYLRDITPLEEIEKYKEYQMSQKEYREMGFGKPTKKDRRNIRKFLGD
ncbi:MAG: RNA-binding S4 domain-containing protein [Crocinitomicaceae bacterium]